MIDDRKRICAFWFRMHGTPFCIPQSSERAASPSPGSRGPSRVALWLFTMRRGQYDAFH
jgi:hypothetical protein